MGSLVSALTTRLRLRLDVTANDTAFPDANVRDLLNQAVAQLSLEADWPWLTTSQTFNTVSGTSENAPPTGWLRTISLTETSTGYPLPLRDSSELDRITATGRPLVYATDGELIILKPTPDGVYALKHRYVKSETPSTAGTDTFLCPAQFEDGIIEYATYLGARILHRDVESNKALEAYDRFLKRARDNRARSSETRRIKVRPGSMV